MIPTTTLPPAVLYFLLFGIRRCIECREPYCVGVMTRDSAGCYCCRACAEKVRAGNARLLAAMFATPYGGLNCNESN